MTIHAQPRLDTKQAAGFLGFAVSTLKISRVTGTLAGVKAPAYRKLGRKVVYDTSILEDWLGQFGNQPNTAAK